MDKNAPLRKKTQQKSLNFPKTPRINIHTGNCICNCYVLYDLRTLFCPPASYKVTYSVDECPDLAFKCFKTHYLM
jgi:hypothetical protein